MATSYSLRCVGGLAFSILSTILLGCGAVPPSAPKVSEAANLVQTALGGDKLARKSDIGIVPDFPFAGPTVKIDSGSAAKGQEILGFGGAFTEASAIVFKGLSPEARAQVLELYWGPDGIGYTTGRVHINSCDFSPKSYSFDDVDGDFNLDHFDMNVTHDQDAMIPFIKAAQDVMQKNGQHLKLLANPWSPPAWMKNNQQMDNSFKPCLKSGSEVHDAWARYFAKFISAYKDQGIPIWAVTPQNEPENNASWEACLLTPEEETEWIASHLGPRLKEAHPDVKIFLFDHNKDDVYNWTKALYSHPTAPKYVAGIAYHWYTGDYFDRLAQIQHDFPQANLWPSEATYERYRWKKGSTLETGDWGFGEGYAHDIIGDLNHGAIGWNDWNLLLNQEGGPNHVDNVCDGAILADNVSSKLYVHPQYYFMGQFSKYILPGSRYLTTVVENSQTYSGPTRPYGTCTGDDGLQATSFLRQDGMIVSVVLNCGDTPINFKLQDNDRAVNATIPAHAIQTYIFQQKPAHAFVV